MKYLLSLILVCLIVVASNAQILPIDGKTQQNGNYTPVSKVNHTGKIFVWNPSKNLYDAITPDSLMTDTTKLVNKIKFANDSTNFIAKAVSAIDINAGSTSPIFINAKNGQQWRDSTKSIQYTKVSLKRWKKDVCYGSDTTEYINAANDTIGRADVWKNPYISVVAGQTIDFIYKNNNWVPQKVFLTVLDFGAKSDSLLYIDASGWTVNDTAFHKYTQWCVANSQNIYIPKGKYLVNLQKNVAAGEKNVSFLSGDVSTPTYKTIRNLIDLLNVDGIKIQFEKGAEIHINGNTYHGSFLANGSNQNVDGSNLATYGYSTKTGHGAIVSIKNSKNVTVTDMTVNGHRDLYILGGTWYGGNEEPGTGMEIFNCFNTVIDNVSIKKAGLDAIYIYNTDYSTETGNVIKNSYFGYSNRNNISWTGGNGLKMTDCVSEKAGYGASWSSAPAANMDIETECYVTSCNSETKNGLFVNCSFTQSLNASIDISNYMIGSNTHKFVNCDFQSTANYSAVLSGKRISFQDCKFYTPLAQTGSTYIYQDRTIFNNCIFTDSIYKGDTMYYSNAYYDYVFYFSSDFTEIKNCKINCYSYSPFWFENPHDARANIDGLEINWFNAKYIGITKYRGGYKNCKIKNVKYNSSLMFPSGGGIYVSNDNVEDLGGNSLPTSTNLVFENNSVGLGYVLNSKSLYSTFASKSNMNLVAPALNKIGSPALAGQFLAIVDTLYFAKDTTATTDWIRLSTTNTNPVLVGGNTTASALSVGTTTAQDLNLITNNVNRITVKSGGNVGIGTTSPSYPLQVFGQAVFNKIAGYGLTAAIGNAAFGLNTLSSATGTFNSAFGDNALVSNTTGGSNSALGYAALGFNTTGSNNSAMGFNALYSNTIGNYNSALGYAALGFNTTGSNNIAMGYQSLYSNTTGSNNSAMGYQGLYSNTTGNYNSALGYAALGFNTTGSNNSALGYQSLYSNTIGSNNSAMGFNALYSNTTGNYNSALGYSALGFNTIGGSNSALGYQSLYNNTTGSNNIAIGINSANAIKTGSNNIIIGINGYVVGATQDVTLNNTIAIAGRIFSDSSGKTSIGSFASKTPDADLQVIGDVHANGTFKASTLAQGSVTDSIVTEAIGGTFKRMDLPTLNATLSQSGNTSIAVLATGATGTATITFSPTFATVPNIVVSPNVNVGCYITAVSTSGATITCTNNTVGALTPSAIYWIARK